MTSKSVDATRDLLSEINSTHATDYQLLRPFCGGFQSGAWLIAGHTGAVAVLKWSADRSWAAQIGRAAAAVDVVRHHGYPTPAWLLVGRTSDGYGYQVQEYVMGAVRERLTPDVARTAIGVLESQAGLDPDPARSWSDYVAKWMDCQLSSSLAAVTATGDWGRKLAVVAAALLTRYDLPQLPEGDLVHGDFRLGNLLFDAQGKIAAVIDVEALGSGSRVFDYATLLDHQDTDDQAVELLVEAATAVAGPAALAYTLVHVALDLTLFMERRVASGELELRHLGSRVRSLAERVERVSRELERP